MPTSHGSLLFKGLGPVDSRLGARRPPSTCRRDPDRQDGGARVRHAALHAHQGLGRDPEPVEPRSDAGRVERRVGGRGRGGDGALRHRLGRRRIDADPGLVLGAGGFKPSHGRIPHPDVDPSQTATYGAMVTTVADCARHLDVVAGPHDDDRLTLPPTHGALRGRDGVARRRSGCVSGGRPTWVRRGRPGGARAGAGRGRGVVRGSGAGAGPTSTSSSPIPIRTWLSIGALSNWLSTRREGALGAGADELTPYRALRPRSGLRPTDAQLSPTASAAACRSRRTWPECSRRSTSC